MRRTVLPGAAGRRTSALGYGCAALMGRTGRADSVRLLEEALEAGVTHFDVARSYGWGAAEGAVGEFLAGRRDEVTVTTKLGIAPPAASGPRTLAKGALRRLPGAASLKRLVRRRAEGMQQTGAFSLADARASLDKSLAELRTDRVDVLLMHECQPEDLTDDLLAFLQGRVDDGSIGCFGVATRREPTLRVLATRPDFASVVQVADNLCAPLGLLPGLDRRLLVTHSALAVGLEEIHGGLTANLDRARRWSNEVGVDLGRREELAALMLRWATLHNRHGMVLFSSRDPARIGANVAAALDEGRDEAAERLAELVAAEGPTPTAP